MNRHPATRALAGAILLTAAWVTQGFVTLPTPPASTSAAQNYRTHSSAIRRSSSGSGSRIGAKRSLVLSSSPVSQEQQQARELIERANALRQEAARLELEARVDEEKKRDASFRSFDTNGDDVVDLKELQAGLERELREDLRRRLQFEMGRLPTEAELDAKIADLPNGTLLTEDLARRVLEMLDSNKDGFLQREEFLRTSDVRMKLDKIINDDRQALAEERRQKTSEEEKAMAQYEEARRVGMPLPQDYNNGEASPADRLLLAPLAYLLPLLDSVNFAEHLFSTFPQQMAWAQPLLAAYAVYRSIPLSGLGLILFISFAAGNPSVNRLARFHLRQAVNLDIALFFVSFIIGAVSAVGGGGAGLATSMSDVAFLSVVAASLYATASTVLGGQGSLPFLTPRAPDLLPFNDDDDDADGGNGPNK